MQVGPALSRDRLPRAEAVAVLERMRLPRRPAATGESLPDDEQWDLCDLPDIDEMLYPTWEALVLHRVQHFAGVALGLAAVLSPWWWLALVALILYVVVDLVVDA